MADYQPPEDWAYNVRRISIVLIFVAWMGVVDFDSDAIFRSVPILVLCVLQSAGFMVLWWRLLRWLGFVTVSPWKKVRR